MKTLSELEREAYATQNQLALDIFIKLDYLYVLQIEKYHPLKVEAQREHPVETT